MSQSRAGKLLAGLQFHHLGFGFFWAVTFIALTGFQERAQILEPWRLYTLSEQAIIPLAVALLGFGCARRCRELPSWLSTVAAFMLSGAALLYFLVFHLGDASLGAGMIAGVLMGGSSALFFLLWQTFFVSEGRQRSIIYIPLSAVLSIVLYFVVSLLPEAALMFTSVVVLPFLALLTLQRSLSEIDLYPLTVFDRTAVATVVADLWRPVLCVCSVGFVWKLVARLGTVSSEGATMAVLLGFAAAALVVAALELFLTRGFDILHIYQMLFPALTVLFLVPSLLGNQYTTLLVGFLMFGFEVVNLLLLVTCAVYTAQHTLPPSPLYALCVAPVLACMVVGDAIGQALSPSVAGDVAHGAAVLLLCVVLLSIALVIVARGRRKVPATVSSEQLSSGKPAFPTVAETDAQIAVAESPAQALEDRQEAMHSYLRDHGLSPRETEVAELLMRGHSIAAIASKLFISENTTRGHVKNIYKKLDVHSRQELVDLGEQEFE
ncbi:LuxR C-terminal-related transcriptional regulator [Adlercreutzia equolifaciens]|uniref:helix-turn-helix transcriptional regulator n=1 Tax=Adlercreutzia equolifaciens TaxID=446660 RepID=UPI0023B06D5D|nr:LuxR family transcriptional regulator [Adlercreutzia equolifaciens]MDE8703425.1 LuxR C-terminal-related transcriptional regulator [Adlercreutzia equolifaciens]